MVVDFNAENNPVFPSNVELDDEKTFFLEEEKLKKRVLVETQEEDQKTKKTKEVEESMVKKDDERRRRSRKDEDQEKGANPKENRGRKRKPRDEDQEELPVPKKTKIQNDEKEVPREALQIVVLVEKINRRWPQKSLRKERLEDLHPEIPTIVPNSNVFLRRNHMGFRMENFDEDLLKEKTSIETYLLKKQVRSVARRESKKLKKNDDDDYDLKKIDGIVDYLLLERSLQFALLTENTVDLYGGRRDILPSGVFVIFEFYNVQSTISKFPLLFDSLMLVVVITVIPSTQC